MPIAAAIARGGWLPSATPVAAAVAGGARRFAHSGQVPLELGSGSPLVRDLERALLELPKGVQLRSREIKLPNGSEL